MSWREQAMALFENARDLTEEERDAYRKLRHRLSTIPLLRWTDLTDEERDAYRKLRHRLSTPASPQQQRDTAK